MSKKVNESNIFYFDHVGVVAQFSRARNSCMEHSKVHTLPQTISAPYYRYLKVKLPRTK